MWDLLHSMDLYSTVQREYSTTLFMQCTTAYSTVQYIVRPLVVDRCQAGTRNCRSSCRSTGQSKTHPSCSLYGTVPVFESAPFRREHYSDAEHTSCLQWPQGRGFRGGAMTNRTLHVEGGACHKRRQEIPSMNSTSKKTAALYVTSQYIQGKWLLSEERRSGSSSPNRLKVCINAFRPRLALNITGVDRRCCHRLLTASKLLQRPFFLHRLGR